jgi:hypothetical protein
LKNHGAITTKRILTALAILFPFTALAQSIYVYPTVVTAPRGSYQSCTAVVTGVNDKTVTWSASGGTIVGTNPSTANEPSTVALYTTTAGTYTLTATTNTGSVAAYCTITVTASPTPLTAHPRLYITPTIVTALQAKANSGNPLFVALKANAVAAFTTENSIWSWSCNNGTGQPSSDQTANQQTEVYAQVFALMALIDPSDRTYNWGCYAHDIWVYFAINVVAESEPISSDRMRYSGLALSVTTDWLMGAGLLNSTEQAEAATFLHYLGQQIVSNGLGGIPPVASSGYNSSAQFTFCGSYDFVCQRNMGYNYMEGKFLILSAIGITFDDTTGEDPTLTNCAGGRYAVCTDYSANSLRAYWDYFVGTYLYKQYAHLEDPAVSWAAYQAAYSNLPASPTLTVCSTTYTSTAQVPCFGDGRGGGPAEGNGYGYSVYSVGEAFNLIHTAGMDDPLLYGPQMSAVSSSWRDLNVQMELRYLAGLYVDGSYNHWAFFSTGDTNTYERFSYNYPQLTADMVYYSYTGRNTDWLVWPVLNTAMRGISNFMTYDLVSGPAAQSLATDMFIALPSENPVTSPPADPRPSLPVDYWDAGNQQEYARTGWTTSDTTVATFCANSLMPHDHEYCGAFDIFSKGEYITKHQVVFDDDYNNAMADSTNSNLVSYLNNPTSTSCTPSPYCYPWQAAQFGGQWGQNSQQGSITPVHSELPAYTAFRADETGAYNATTQGSSVLLPYANSNIDSASRSLVYIRGSNQVAYYDRGSSTTNAWDKALFMMTTGAITISGNTASWATRSTTQQAYLTSLLPASPTISDVGLDPTNRGPAQADDWEPYSRVKIDAGSVTATQFLTVLEWGAAGSSKSTTTLVESSAGQNFDGALVGANLVMFMRNWPATFTSVTYPASGATTHYISDLSPNTTYCHRRGRGAGTSATTDTAGSADASQQREQGISQWELPMLPACRASQSRLRPWSCRPWGISSTRLPAPIRMDPPQTAPPRPLGHPAQWG